jgi:hypothetical protein
MISNGNNSYVVAFLGNNAKQEDLAEAAANIGKYVGDTMVTK